MRHADAGDREAWDGEDRLRPLSAKGSEQAVGLVGVLEGQRVARICSSPFVRCVQTVEPFARARGLVVEPVLALQEGADWREAMRLIIGTTDSAVLCSQGDVIGSVVYDLVGRGLAGRDARWQKGSTWVLEVAEGRVAAARYVAPKRG